MTQQQTYDPDAYDEHFEDAGRLYDLDPRWIKAHAMQESGMNPQAVGDGGQARGLMQLHPAAAEETGVEDRWHPRQSIFGGARYLRTQLDRFGDPDLASMAYNAGPNGNFNPDYLMRVQGHYDRFKRAPWRSLPPANTEDLGPREPVDISDLKPKTGGRKPVDLSGLAPKKDGATAQAPQAAQAPSANIPLEQRQQIAPIPLVANNPQGADLAGLETPGEVTPDALSSVLGQRPPTTMAQLTALAQGLPEGVGGLLAGLGRAGSHAQQDLARGVLRTLQKIDRGEPVSPIDDVLGYRRMSPERRRQVRHDVEMAANPPRVNVETPITARMGNAAPAEEQGPPLSPEPYEPSVKPLPQNYGGVRLGVADTVGLGDAAKVTAGQPIQAGRYQANLDGAAPRNVGWQDMAPPAPQPEEPQNALTRAGEAVRSWGEHNLVVPPEEQGVTTKALRMVGGLPAFVAPAVVGGALAGPPGAIAGGALVAGAQSYDNTYRDALAKGASQRDAISAARTSALTQGALMGMPIARLMSRIPVGLQGGFTDLLIDLGKHGVEFSTFSGLGRLADNFVAQQTYDPHRTLGEGVGDAVLEGALAGVAMRGATSAMRRRGTPPAQPRPKEDFGVAPDTAWPMGEFREQGQLVAPENPSGEPSPQGPVPPVEGFDGPSSAPPPSRGGRRTPPPPPAETPAEAAPPQEAAAPAAAETSAAAASPAEPPAPAPAAPPSAESPPRTARAERIRKAMEAAAPPEPAAEQPAIAMPAPATTPEPQADVAAQVRALTDPGSGKDAVFIAAGTPMPQVPQGVMVVQKGAGTLITTNGGKARRFDQAPEVTDDLVADLLGYSESKGDVARDVAATGEQPVVVQATDGQGDVVQEQLASPGHVAEAEAAVAAQAPADANIAVTTPDAAQERREAQTPAPQPETPREHVDISDLAPVPPRPQDAHGNPIFEEGDRVVVPASGGRPARNGVIVKRTGMQWRPVFGGKTSDPSYHYEVKTDAGTTVTASKLQQEIGEPPEFVPDPEHNGIARPIDSMVVSSVHEWTAARRAQESAAKARKPDMIAQHKRNAAAAAGRARAIDAVIREWVDRHPEAAVAQLGEERAAKWRTSPAAAPEAPAPAAPSGSMDIIPGKHGKFGHDIWTVPTGERVERAEFERRRDLAKELGGNYSSFRGRGAIPGFEFREEAKAREFVRRLAGGKEAAPEGAQEQRTAEGAPNFHERLLHEQAQQIAGATGNRIAIVRLPDREDGRSAWTWVSLRPDQAVSVGDIIQKTERNPDGFPIAQIIEPRGAAQASKPTPTTETAPATTTSRASSEPAPAKPPAPTVQGPHGDFGDYRMFSPGQRLVSDTGRELSPVPNFRAPVDNRSFQAARRAIDTWVRAEAIAEAVANGNTHLARILDNTDPQNYSMSDRDTAMDVLFGSDRGPTEKHGAQRPATASAAPASSLVLPSPDQPIPNGYARLPDGRLGRIPEGFPGHVSESPATAAQPAASTEKAPPSTERPEDAAAKPEASTEQAEPPKSEREQEKERLRKKLFAKFQELRTGLDPETLLDAVRLTRMEIEDGLRKFADYATMMVDTFGRHVTPFLRQLYEAARWEPGFDNRGMSEPHEIAAHLAKMEAEHAVPDTVRPGDERAGPRPDDGVEEGRPPGQLREPEVQAGAGDVRPTDRGGAEGSQRPADNAGEASSGGDRAGDADRVPAEAGPEHGGAAERPAAERPDADVKGVNFQITDADLAEGRGPAAKARDNVAAIELAKRLTEASEAATREQQAALVKYVGWGGLKNAFPDPVTGRFAKGMEDVGERLRDLLTPEEYATAQRSTQYAHYTAAPVIRAMWDAMAHLGFKGGTVFEPGMGIGHFLGLMPRDMATRSAYQGVEMDHLTTSIARLLYPESGVRRADFTQMALPEGEFDIAIGNPPFGDITIQSDPKYRSQGLLIHDYFIAKSLDAVRPGGLLAMVTSTGTLNKMDPSAREYMAQRAQFLGAVRLPGGTFGKNAGTEVTTDIIFLQRRPEGKITKGQLPTLDWLRTDVRELPGRDGKLTSGHVNRYFSKHPEMVLGEEGFTDTLYGGERYAVRPREGQDLEADLREAIGRLPRDVMTERPSAEQARIRDFDSGQMKDGSFYMKDGVLMQYRGGVGNPVAMRASSPKKGGATAPKRAKGEPASMTKDDRERIVGLIPIRDALRDVFRHDLAQNEREAADARSALNAAYDRFVKKFGPINKAEITTRRPTRVEEESARQAHREEVRERGEYFNSGTFDERAMLDRGEKLTDIARARAEARERAASLALPWDEGDFNPETLPDKLIEKRPNLKPFREDPESYRLSAIEAYDDITGEASKKTIFREPTVGRMPEPRLETAHDGMLWSLNQFGRLDLDRIAEEMGKAKDSLIVELGDAIYRLPGTRDGYQTAEEYLSGDVVGKREEAEARVRDEPDLQRNIDALVRARPPLVPPHEVSMTLGMPWVPIKHFQDFADSLGLGRPKIAHVKAIGRWDISAGGGQTTAGMATWGTERVNAMDILEHAFNRTQPRVYDQIDRDTRVFNATATQAAVDKVDEINQAFQDWGQEGPRGEELAALYNEAMNREAPWKGTGAYLKTPGVRKTWEWRPHQKRAIARVIQLGNTYLAHGVGAGKTSEMIGAAMEMKRLGLVNKPMVIVPNHMLTQFTTEWYDLYPTARLMIADEEGFITHRRRNFVAAMSQDDLDGVVMTHSSFKKLPISDEFGSRMVQEAIDELEDALRQVDRDDRFTRRALENQKEKLEQKLRGMQNADKDQTLTFEETGVDFLFVDEAHLFRKLQFATIQRSLKGISPEGSDSAWDLYTKARYLDTVRPNRSLVLASGTPITNTMGELYSVSRYLQPAALRDRGLAHFDSWAQNFGTTGTSLEQEPDGGFKPVTRFNRFVNTPELYRMVSGVMDVVTGEELGTLVNRPRVAGGSRKLKIADRSERLAEYQQELGDRMDAIKARTGPPQPGDDILLSVINDGRLAALDMRFIDGAGGTPSNIPSKLDQAIDNVVDVYRRTTDHQFYNPANGYAEEAFRGPATQMIFANFGVNPAGPARWSGYDHIRKALIAKGIPANEIAFIRDAKTHLARQRLFNDMNSGRIRILVGSTAQMGTGVNAQKRLVAIHNIDPLWYPADDEQRVGRGLRQGNFNREIGIYDYTTRGTYDATMWGMMAKKGRFIEDFFRGDPSLREMNDIGEASMYEQAAAMTVSDPRVIELAEVNDQLRRLERQKSAHDSRQHQLKQEAAYLRKAAASDDESASEMDDIVAKLKPTRGDAFEMTVGDQTFTKRVPAAEALKKEIEAVVAKAAETLNERELWVADIGGLRMYVEPRFYKKGDDRGKVDFVSLRLKLTKDRTRYISIRYGEESYGGSIASAESVIAGLFDEAAALRRNAVEKREKAAELETLLGKPFPAAAEIGPLRRRAVEIETALKGGGNDKAAAPAPKPAATEAPEDWPQVGEEDLGIHGAPLFGRRTPVPLYSAVERAAEGLKQARGTGEQMLAALQKTPGVRQEELDWIGLPAWLKGQQRVTKEQVAEFIRANRVDVLEVEKGKWSADQPTRYSEYALPGGERYRELLLTLPPSDAPYPPVGRLERLETNGRWLLNWDDGTKQSFATRDEAEAVMQRIAERLGRQGKPRPGEYKSPHWDEPNVLAHVRFDDRTAPDGSQVLMVHEVQSDWHQRGRKEGYKGKINDLPPGWRVEEIGGQFVATDAAGRHLTAYGHATRAEATAEAVQSLNRASRYAVPDAPYKTSWPALVLRRMIKYAVDNGYDRIAWSPGETHADRYDLSEQVSGLAWQPSTGDLYVKARGASDYSAKPTARGVTKANLADHVGKDVAETMLARPADDDGYHVAEGADLKAGGSGMRAFYDKMLPAEANKIIGKFGAKVESGHLRSLSEETGGRRGLLEPVETPDGWMLVNQDGDSINDDPILYDTEEEAAGEAQRESERRGLLASEQPRPVHQFDITPRMRAVVADEGLPLFVRPEDAAPTAAPHPEAVQAFIDEANRLTGGNMRVEAYQPGDDVFTIRFKGPDGRESTEQVFGYVWGRLLRAAIEGDRTQWNFDHETAHALKALGLIDEREWAALMDEAKRQDWYKRYNIDRRYPDAEPWLRDEEAFAEAMADARFKPPPPGSVLARVIARIKAFFARLRNLLAGRGFQTAEDVFGRIFSGEVGEREVGSRGPTRGPQTAEESVQQASQFNRMTFGRRGVPEGFRRDNPGGRWLERKQQDAEAAQAAAKKPETPDGRGLAGSTTASVASVELPTEFLAQFPGVMGERPAPGSPKFDRLTKSIAEQGWSRDEAGRVMLFINHKGEPFIWEGNNRIAAAVANGVPSLSTEVQWLNGGEDAAGPASPAAIAQASNTSAPTFGRRPTDTPERRDEIVQAVNMRARLERTPRIGRALAAVYDATGTAMQVVERAISQAMFPMRLGTVEAQAKATQFANGIREVNERYGRLDREWEREFTPVERRQMAHSMTNQSLFEVMLREELRQMPEEERAPHEGEMRRLFNADGAGIAGLPAELREVVQSADAVSATLWEHMRRAGLVRPEAERIPFYFPRQGVIGEADVPYRRIRPSDEVPRPADEDGDEATPSRRSEREGRRNTSMEPIGRNLSASGPMRRRYPSWDETQAAGRARFGDNFKLVDDIRMLPQVWARSERALVGRRLVDQIKAYGADTGQEWVREGMQPSGGKWFTLPHPALQRWVPRWPEHPDEDGKIEPVKDAEGHIIYDRAPIHISEDFKGPLQAVLSRDPDMWYRGMMLLKGASMHAIMWNPMKHLMVEVGRAFPLVPGDLLKMRTVDRDQADPMLPAIPLPRGKVITGLWIAKGDAEINDRAAMKRWIATDGIAPIGQGWAMDPASVMEQAEAPYGRIPGLVWLRQLADNAARTAGRKLGPFAEQVARHPQQELLWNMVYRLQMAIATTMRDRFMEDGLNEPTARAASSFMANRFAGALPPEHLSRALNMLTNLTLFSRSFTLGNLGVVKDAIKGPPGHILADISDRLGPEAAKQAKEAIRKASRHALIADMGLFYIFNGLMQTAIKIGIAAGAVGVLGALKDAYDDWLDKAWAGLNEEHDPFKVFPQQWNEPGRTDRIYLYTDAQGRGVYLRPSMAKVGEDLAGWLAHPAQMAENKASPHFKAFIEAIVGKDTLGRYVRNPNPHGIKEYVDTGWDSLKHVIATPMVPDVAGPIADVLSGRAASHPEGTMMEALFMLSGFGTISHGATPHEPGLSGPETGAKYAEQERMRFFAQRLMRDVTPELRLGHYEKAAAMIEKSDLPEPEKVRLLRSMKPATSMSSGTKRLYESGWNPSRVTGAQDAR